MKNNTIKYISILAILITSSCSTIKPIKISKDDSQTIKGQEFTIISKQRDLLNFTSQSFLTSFTGIFIPFGIIWFPKINGKNQAKEFDLKDPNNLFEKEISKILTEKFNMKFIQNSIIADTRDIKKLSETYKDYQYIVEIDNAGYILYIRLDDHAFSFNANFRLIDTKNSKEISNVACNYITDKNNYRDKDYYFRSDARNLKAELSKAVSQCIKVFNAQI